MAKNKNAGNAKRKKAGKSLKAGQPFPYVITLKHVLGELSRTSALHSKVRDSLHPDEEAAGKTILDPILAALSTAEKVLADASKGCPNGMQRVVVIDASRLASIGQEIS